MNFNDNFPGFPGPNPGFMPSMLKALMQEAAFLATDKTAKEIQSFMKDAREGKDVDIGPDGFIRVVELSFKPLPNDKWLIRSPTGAMEREEDDAWLAAYLQMVTVSMKIAEDRMKAAKQAQAKTDLRNKSNLN